MSKRQPVDDARRKIATLEAQVAALKDAHETCEADRIAWGDTCHFEGNLAGYSDAQGNAYEKIEILQAQVAALREALLTARRAINEAHGLIDDTGEPIDIGYGLDAIDAALARAPASDQVQRENQ